MIDTHAHYDDEQFNSDRETLLRRLALEGQVTCIVNAGSSVASWEAVLSLTKTYDFVFGAIGVHPDEVGDLTEDEFTRMQKLSYDEKIVAIGEIGLDYYWKTQTPEVQKTWFIRQLLFAKERGLPVIIHSRDAAEDTLEIVKAHGEGLTGIVHCFSYSKEIASEYIKRGFYIGVGGVVTFPNAKKLKEVVAETPMTRILLETDCPYLAPVPFRGKRNDSGLLTYVAEEIARIKGITAAEVIRVTTKNAKEIYRI